jgi:hypothetical protein
MQKLDRTRPLQVVYYPYTIEEQPVLILYLDTARNAAMLMVKTNYALFQDILDTRLKYVVHIIWMGHVPMVFDVHLYMIPTFNSQKRLGITLEEIHWIRVALVVVVAVVIMEIYLIR